MIYLAVPLKLITFQTAIINNVSMNDLLPLKSLLSDYFLGHVAYKPNHQVKGQNAFKSLDREFADCFSER